MVNQVKLTFLGGVGEIGMNCLAIETDLGVVLVDCGLMFPGDRIAGPEFILPDINFIRGLGKRLKAVVLTHGHEDHIGAIPFLGPWKDVQFYGPAFALAVLREKCSERPGSLPGSITKIRPGDEHVLAGLPFRFFRVTHSIPDSLGIEIETPHGLIVHTGDFRIDQSPSLGERFDVKALDRMGQKGVLLLMSDSTNVEREGHTRSESWVADGVRNLVTPHRGRVLVSLFSSNIERVSLMARIAKESGRRLGLIGRSLYMYTRAAMESGYYPLDPGDLVASENAENLPDSKVMLLVAGSQGEPRSSLTRISVGDHPDVSIKSTDMVIFSSRIIPGNEKDITRVTNDLARLGAEVYYEGNAQVHTSGHAMRSELSEVLERLRPKYFIPVHGEYRFLRNHARLAEQLVGAVPFIAGLGDILSIEDGFVRWTGRIDLKQYFVEGDLIGTAEEMKLKERKKLLFNGIVCAHCLMRGKKNSKRLFANISLYGIPDPDGSLEREIKDIIEMEMSNRTAQVSSEVLTGDVESIIKRIMRRRQDKRPIIHVTTEE